MWPSIGVKILKLFIDLFIPLKSHNLNYHNLNFTSKSHEPVAILAPFFSIAIQVTDF